MNRGVASFFSRYLCLILLSLVPALEEIEHQPDIENKHQANESTQYDLQCCCSDRDNHEQEPDQSGEDGDPENECRNKDCCKHPLAHFLYLLDPGCGSEHCDGRKQLVCTCKPCPQCSVRVAALGDKEPAEACREDRSDPPVSKDSMDPFGHLLDGLDQLLDCLLYTSDAADVLLRVAL